MKKAFTLVELLVVIAIISMIAVLGMISLSNARMKSRDAKRVSDIKQLQVALDMYYDANNRYPSQEEWDSGAIYSSSSAGNIYYITSIPQAPNPPDRDCSSEDNAYTYEVIDNGDSYRLSFCLGGKVGGLDFSGPVEANSLGIFSSGESSSWSCGDNLAYSGQNYSTVQIGTQCWFAENLNVGTRVDNPGTYPECYFYEDRDYICQNNNSLVEKFCYNDNENNCDIYGGLYTWMEVMNLPFDCNSAWPIVDNGDGTYVIPCPLSGNQEISIQHQGICPSGWHLPSNSDWSTLISYVGSQGYSGAEGTALKSTSYPVVPGTDNFNFSIISTFMASYFELGGYEDFGGALSFIWTSSMYLDGDGAAWAKIFGPDVMVDGSLMPRTWGFAARCLKN